MNTKIISSLAEPIYPINYDTAQIQAGNTYTCNITYNIIGSAGIDTIVQIQNPNASNVTSTIKSLNLYTSDGNNTYGVFLNASLSGALTPQTIYNTNIASANSSKTIISAASSSSIGVSGSVLFVTSNIVSSYTQILPSQLILTANNSLFFLLSPPQPTINFILNIVFSES